MDEEQELDDLLKDPEKFLGYVELHAQTPRALFHLDHVNRLLEMAGEDTVTVPEDGPEDVFIVLRPEMADPYVKAARARLDP